MQDKVDVLVWEPNAVDTRIFEKLSGKKAAENIKKTFGTFMLPCDIAVEKALTDLGRERVTWGHWKHNLTNNLVCMIVPTLIEFFGRKMYQ